MLKAASCREDAGSPTTTKMPLVVHFLTEGEKGKKNKNKKKQKKNTTKEKVFFFFSCLGGAGSWQRACRRALTGQQQSATCPCALAGSGTRRSTPSPWRPFWTSTSETVGRNCLLLLNVPPSTRGELNRRT